MTKSTAFRTPKLSAHQLHYGLLAYQLQGLALAYQLQVRASANQLQGGVGGGRLSKLHIPNS